MTFKEDVLEEYKRKFDLCTEIGNCDCVEEIHFISQALDRQMEEVMKCIPKTETIESLNYKDDKGLWQEDGGVYFAVGKNNCIKEILDNLKQAGLIKWYENYRTIKKVVKMCLLSSS